jgi:putative ABC transport system permease protein
VQRVLPIRSGKSTLDEKQVLVLAIAAAELYEVESVRAKAEPAHKTPNPLYKQLGAEENAMVVSENFRVLHGTRKGDYITLTTDKGPVRFHVIGEMVDYSWNNGSLIVSMKDYARHWDNKVEVFDVYLEPGAATGAIRDKILRAGAEYGLEVRTRGELQERIDGMIERLYGIAYGQLVVVMIVAALGVVTALLISVLQRRREMGLLRAIGASQTQIVRSVLAEAGLMGAIGTIIGLIVGIPMEWYVLRVVLLEESGYLFAMHVPWVESLIIASAAIILATLAGLGPALYAVRERIPEAIAYE